VGADPTRLSLRSRSRVAAARSLRRSSQRATFAGFRELSPFSAGQVVGKSQCPAPSHKPSRSAPRVRFQPHCVLHRVSVSKLPSLLGE
jgi:hypothetical protein